ncbi:AIPR family protein [Sorangium sp. So ce513]|uniref:AIPR family protein n=1 Tax=Sorangium sp. So ce513 TaxID=3133315 RepID=UPI003F5FBFA9
MSVVQVNQVKAQLKSQFSGLIDMADATARAVPAAEQEQMFLTRALAAYAATTLAGAQPAVAAAHVTDGFEDNGIDVVYFDDVDKRLYLVQSKWVNAGNKSPELGDVQKFIAGCDDLIGGSLVSFNTKTQALSANIARALADTDLRIVLVLIYTGTQTISKYVAKALQKFQAEQNSVSDLVETEIIDLRGVYRALTTAAEGVPINIDVMISDWGHVTTPFEAYYGQVNASDIAQWHIDHGDKLFSRNLRKLIPSSEVNKTIADSARTKPDQFWYLNNGITVLCDALKKKPLGGADRASGVFECKGISVVNGAQTVGSLSAAHKQSAAAVQQARVLVRFISLENCPEGFATEVTRATNMQNRIENRDFASLDPQQLRLRQEFVMDGKYYALKTGEPAPAPDQGLTIDEATVALACARPEVQHAVIAKAALGRFWENTEKPPYRLLFNSGLTSLRLWRLVELLRVIDETLRATQPKDSKAAGVAVHGNRFVAHEVYLRVPLNKLDDPSLDVVALVNAAKALVPKVHEATTEAMLKLFPTSYPGSLFKNAGKCSELSTELSITLPL